MNQHKATPEQWRHIEKLSAYCIYDKAILELLDRIEAAEQRISKLEQPSPDHLRDAMEMVPTDQKLCAVFSDEGYGDEPIGVALRRLYDLGRRNAANSSAVLTSSNHPVIPDSSPTPAGGLMERVIEAIDPEDPPCYHVEAARAAILAELSPAAQAVLAACGCPDLDSPFRLVARGFAAAALRAAAEEATQSAAHCTPSSEWGEGWKEGVEDAARGLLALAAELEGRQ